MVNFIRQEFELFKPTVRPATIRQVDWAIGVLGRFELNKWSDVDYSWPKKFNNFLINENYSHNSIREVHRKIGKFFPLAVRAGLIAEDYYSEFVMGEFKSNKIYLNNEEIEKMENLFKISKRRDIIRDAFLICSYTALRKSDITSLTADNVIIKQYQGEIVKILHVITKKTNTPIVVPLHPKVEAILEKHEWNFHPNLNHCNIYIKKIAEAAGIDTPVMVSKKVGGTTSIKTVPKWQLIHFHSGRRSAATNMYLAGIDKIAIMRITGHTTEENFMKYICVTEEESALKISGNEFFKVAGVTV